MSIDKLEVVGRMHLKSWGVSNDRLPLGSLDKGNQPNTIPRSMGASVRNHMKDREHRY